MKKTLCLWMALLMLMLAVLPALGEEEVSLFAPGAATPAPAAQPAPATAVPQAEPEAATPLPEGDADARAAFIDEMIALAQSIYRQTNGRAQPANSAGDIYVCKNFTVHLFRKNRDDYRMAAYPDVPLVIPNNLPAKESKPYSYGIAWQDVPAEQGNPFYAAHSFYYDTNLSKEENREKAMAFMRQVQRGDFFQMSADYYYGVGAHSLVFTQDYDADSDSVTWTDSNMKGESRGGKRYGYVQYDAVKPIEWFVDAFCKRGRGATLYRLRDDIINK
ncbi:MAG: hypothetical protein GX653_06975 [Clostridiales bacterium]|nr:hypothetical protein [Clostridiales bacterium]